MKITPSTCLDNHSQTIKALCRRETEIFSQSKSVINEIMSEINELKDTLKAFNGNSSR